jgi:hypothetical protein
LKRVLAFCGIGLFALVFSRPSYALFSSDKAPLVPRWETEIGVNLYDYNYLENLAPPLASQETGFLWGLHLGVTYHLPDNENKLFFKLILDYSGSGTTYNGTTQIDPDTGTATPLTHSTNNTFFNAEFQSGLDVWRWGEEKKWGDADDVLGFFGGIGAHIWQRGDGSEAGTYEEVYAWPYIVVGPRYIHRVDHHWSIGANAALYFMPTGNLNIDLSDLGSTYNYANTSVTLGSGEGIRLEAPIRYQINRTMAVSATPWFEYTTIGSSNTVQVLQPNGSPATYNGSNIYASEPNSRTNQFGAYLLFILSSSK